MHVCGRIDHFSPFLLFVIKHWPESIDSHHHRHAEVLCVLYLLPHVAAALLQQLQVLHAGKHKHIFKYVHEKRVTAAIFSPHKGLMQMLIKCLLFALAKPLNCAVLHLM